MPDQPSERYQNEMDRLLFANGRTAEQINSQASILSEGPALPWTRDQLHVIGGARALLRDDQQGGQPEHTIPLRWRAQAQFMANISSTTMWLMKISDAREADRWLVILAYEDGSYETGPCGYLPR